MSVSIETFISEPIVKTPVIKMPQRLTLAMRLYPQFSLRIDFELNIC